MHDRAHLTGDGWLQGAGPRSIRGGLRETTQELDLEGILRLSDLEDENTGCPVKSEFLTCNESFSVVRLCLIYCIGREGWSRGVFRWLREGGALQSVGTGLRKGAEA